MNSKSREERESRYKWDIEKMYAGADACLADMEEVKERATAYRESYEGRLGESAALLTGALKERDAISRLAEKVYVYARMKRDEDNRIADYQALSSQASAMLADLAEAFSFFAAELAGQPVKKLRRFMDSDEELAVYRHLIEELIRSRKHVLSRKEEALLAAMSELGNATGDAFTMLNNADMDFGRLRDEQGRLVRLTHGSYPGFLRSENRSVRRRAFTRLHGAFQKQRNTLATLYAYNTKQDVIGARIRHHGSALDAALFPDRVPVSVYEGLLEAVDQALPDLHRYMALKKRSLGLTSLKMYDLYVPLTPDPGLTFTYEEAWDTMVRGLEPLGEDYARILETARQERWADVYENEGKTSGAYSFGSYDSLPYMLLNFDGRLEDVFTLVHEMGHSVHAWLTRAHQPYVYGSHSIFTAEVASTVNEALLMDHLLSQAAEEGERAYLTHQYLEAFRTTLFRQALFADFEKRTHQAVEEGLSLTADWLDDLYLTLNRRYYGPDLSLDSFAAAEWSRIPHFYRAFYVYKYATGYSAATALSRGILKGGGEARERYLGFLKAGESDHPIELLKGAGVDMSRQGPVRDALAVFGELVDDLSAMLGR